MTGVFPVSYVNLTMAAHIMATMSPAAFKDMFYTYVHVDRILNLSYLSKIGLR